MDMVLYYLLTTVITCTSDTPICYTDYCYTYMFHWYTDIPIHGVSHFILLLSSLHGCSIHSYLMFTHHCYICSPQSVHACIVLIFLSYESLYILHVLLFHVIPVFLLYDCFPLLILLFLLLDMSAIDMRCVELSATWIEATGPPLESHIYCFPFPIILFSAINRTQVMLSCYMYHALYLFLFRCVL